MTATAATVGAGAEIEAKAGVKVGAGAGAGAAASHEAPVRHTATTVTAATRALVSDRAWLQEQRISRNEQSRLFRLPFLVSVVNK